MYNEEGIYIGVPDCKHYIGISHYGIRICCGGKSKVKTAFIQCQLRDTLQADFGCTMYLCSKYDGKQGKRS
jgi:hypothetical protein